MSEKAQQPTHKEPASQPTGPGEAPLPESPAGYPLLALQRTVGNRAVQRLIQQGDARAQRGRAAARVRSVAPARIQRSSLRPDAVQGVDLGSVVVIATETAIPMRAAGELVQAGDTPGQFRGFATLHEALSLSLLQNGFTAIVRDRGEQYHVLEVTESAPVEEAIRSEPREGVPGFTVIRFVNPLIPTPAGVIYGEAPLREQDTWAGRVARAQQLRDRYYNQGRRELRDQLAAAFRSLAADAFSVAPDEIHILFSSDQDIPPDGINIMLDPSVQSSGASGTARRRPPGQARHPVEMEPSEPAGEQRPTLWISADLFDPSGPDPVRAVLRHEASHAGTTERVRQLIGIWQQESEPERDFWAWLRSQQRQRGGGPYQVTLADLQMAMARLYPRSASDEPLACVARFTAEYHRVPPDRVVEGTFDELRYMLANWVAAGEGMPGAGIPSLRDEATRRLRAYYQEQLDETHRAAFDRWVDSLPRGGEERILFPQNPERGYARWGEDGVQNAIGQMRAFRQGAGRARRQ